MTEKEHKEIMAEYEALIDAAWEVTPGSSIIQDPALARNLEWLRDSYLELYEYFQKTKKAE